MDFNVERRVLDPANDSNDPERIYMRNDYLTIFECQVKRKPSAYDYRRMIDLAYEGIKEEIESLAADGFSIFLYVPGAPLESSRLSNGDYDLFSAAQKTGVACLGKYERDNVVRKRFRRYGLYQIPLSSLESAFFYQSTKWNCLIVLSQDRAFLSGQTLEKKTFRFNEGAAAVGLAFDCQPLLFVWSHYSQRNWIV